MSFTPRTGRIPPAPPPRFTGEWADDRTALSTFLEQFNRSLVVESGLGDPTYQYGAFTPSESVTVAPTASTIATAQATANVAWGLARAIRDRIRVGSVTVSGTATSAAVALDPEIAEAAYRVIATCQAVTGSPAAGASTVRTVTKTASGFTLALVAAPGTGTSVTFDFIVFED